MALTIDEDACVGCETCCEIAPEIFKLDDNTGKAVVINPDGDAEKIQEAIDSCPSSAISND